MPFGLWEKVDKKLNQLLELNIIEEVPDGPSGWISSLVVVPKGDGDIRVCVDIRFVNEAIIRERHLIPIVEELLLDLNGSTMSSKIDLRFCSARSVDTSLLSSHTKVFIIISGSTMFSKIDLRFCSARTVDTSLLSSRNKVFTATSG